MSQAQTPAPSTSKFSIVRAISALLKLGDDGKLDSFLARVVKTLKKEVAILKKNLDTMKFNHEQNLEELNDKLQDAQEALADSYLQIDVARIGTNEAQTSYVDVYLENIDNKAAAVKLVEDKIAKAKEKYAEDAKAVQEQVDSLEKRIKTISEEAK